MTPPPTRNYDIHMICSNCDEKQMTRIDECRKCKMPFAKSEIEKEMGTTNVYGQKNEKGVFEAHDLTSNEKYLKSKQDEENKNKSNEEKQNPIKQEISCYRCRSLWIGVAIAGLALTIILNIGFQFLEIGWWTVMDIIRYPIAFLIIGTSAIGTWYLIHGYCKGKDGKGELSWLTGALFLAIVVILMSIFVGIHLNATGAFYTGDLSSMNKEQLSEFVLAENNCFTVKSLFKSDHNDLYLLYHNADEWAGDLNDRVMVDGLYQPNELYEKWKGCNGDYVYNFLGLKWGWK